jgi:phosphopantothenoylcysteine decarboxylase / phosphopantothenate---cysteine ligase
MSAPKGSGSSSVLRGRRVLLGVAGGIAAYKAVFLTRLLVQAEAVVQVVMTPAALRFVGADTFAALTGRTVHSDVFEEVEQVLHVRLAREADVAVVAPATANTLAKLALGLADDLLSSTLLEARCPLVAAPAMHTGMYENPATQSHLAALRDRGVVIVGPASGDLAAGDEGPGRMAEPEEILSAIEAVVSRGRDLAGRRILVTAGPTREPLDPVRFIGNRSSGRMGFAVAEEAAARGASVTVVSGPVELTDPPGIDVVRVETTEQMRSEVLRRLEGVDAVVKAAAVADWRPAAVADHKLKKDGGAPSLELVETADILRELGDRKSGFVLVGFAAETDDLEAAGRKKLAAKNLDLLVVNEVGREGTGFGSDTNNALLLSATGDDEGLRTWTKRELAGAICDRLAKLLPTRG